MQQLVSTVVEQCVAKGIVAESDKDIHVYGGIYLLLSVFNTVFPILLGAVGGCLMEMIIFTAGYCYLRRFSGGYHAQSPLVCFVLSQVMVIVVFLAILNSAAISNAFLITGNVVSIVTIALLSPVETSARPLDVDQRKLFRKKAMFVSSIISIASISLFWVHRPMSMAFMLICGVVAMLMVQGYLTQIIKGK